MTTHRIPWRLAAFGAGVLLLSACGGGGGGDPVGGATHAVPASALSSPAAFTRYVADRPVDDLAPPLDVTGLEPPTSETDEPVALR